MKVTVTQLLSFRDRRALRHRRVTVCLLATLCLGATCIWGGTPCPKVPYEPVGPEVDVNETDECLDDGVVTCFLSCGQGACVEEAWRRYYCEPCERVRSWSEQSCAECLEEYERDGALELSVVCTIE